jgi:putative aminopeptidase FrvX
MTELLSFLKAILMIPGLSGHETRVMRFLEDRWSPLVDEISCSRLGSLHGLKNGSAPLPRPSVLLTAHMDSIGLIVTRVVDGFLNIGAIGGVDPRILPGQAVCVHGRQDLPGVIAMPPARLLPPGAGEGVIDLQHLLVDVGLPPAKVADMVRVGDPVSFDNETVEMAGEFVSGRALDNRVSLAALTLCLQELQARHHAWDVWAVASVQEEVNYAGAASSAFQLRPALAVTVDTTFAKGPGADDWQTFALGQGPTLGYGPNVHPALYRRFKELAEDLEIPYATEFLPTTSGTDGMAIQVTAGGIPNLVLSIPIRYMHTPVEMVGMMDIQRAGRLLAGFVASLEMDFLQGWNWDD